MDYDALLDLALEIGCRLLENGAETYRVEESVLHILDAYGGGQGDAFAVPTCLIVTVREERESGTHSHTRLKRIHERGTNLDRVARLNDLCRRICRDKPDCRTAFTEVEKAACSKTYRLPVQILSAVLIAFSFTLFFGGGIRESLCAVVCGAALKLALRGMDYFGTNWFFANIVGSAIVSLLAVAALRLGLCGQIDSIIIGTLMNLVPGVALTNSMRDIIGGDLISGLTKLVEAVMVAAAIALGTGVVLYGLRSFL